MPSPFPGMNPWIERSAVWQDFHDSFLPAVKAALNAQITPKYLARIQEHVFVDEVDEPLQRIGSADVTVSEFIVEPSLAGAGPVVQTLAPPSRVQQVEAQVDRRIYVEIRDRAHRRLVSVLELLSPANKARGRIRDQYIQKRDEYLRSDAHFIEIDLLRGGPRMPWHRLPPCDYYALVSRAGERPDAGIWPLRLRDPLPKIPIPLGRADADARLDLQQLIHSVYDESGYAHDIYNGDPEPPLPPEDDAWARSLIP